jgi:hypothetical protein
MIVREQRVELYGCDEIPVFTDQNCSIFHLQGNFYKPCVLLEIDLAVLVGIVIVRESSFRSERQDSKISSGFEDWIRYRVSDPATALARLYMHLEALQEMASGARTMADGVAYDPQPILMQLDPKGFLLREANRLEGVVNRVGMPRFQPTRRVDGGTLYPVDGSM